MANLTKPRAGARLNPQHPLSRGLLCWWLFNERGGQTIYDIHSRQSGTLTSFDTALAWSAFDNALTFDASNDQIGTLPPMDVTIGSGDVTISVRFRATELSANRRLFYWGDAATSTNYMNGFVTTGGVVTFQCASGGSVNLTHATTCALDTWYRVVFVRTGTTAQIYLDIVPSSVGSDANFGVSVGPHHLIGAFRTAGTTWGGQIDDFRVWSRVLSLGEIEQLQTAPYESVLPTTHRAVSYFYQHVHRPVVQRTTPLAARQVNPHHAMSHGLVGWWPCNENSGRAVNDLSLNARIATTTNMAFDSRVGSPQGGALRFDGVDDTVNLGSSTDLNPNAAPFSVMARIRLSAGVAGGTIFSKRRVSPTDGWALVISDVKPGALAFQAKGTAGSQGIITADVDLRDDGWHHVAATKVGLDRTDWRLYVDGVSVPFVESGSDLNSAVSTTSDPLRLGALGSSATAFFTGAICDVRYWIDRALSPKEIMLVYTHPDVGLVQFSRPFVGLSFGGTLSPGHTYQHRRTAGHHISFA